MTFRILGGLTLSFLVLVGYVAFQFWYSNNYKTVLQTRKAPDSEVQFVLLTDTAGIGDPAWYVYRLEPGEHLTGKMKTGHDTDDVLFWNYSESGIHSDNSKIEIRNKKYLVFSRGGLFYSLYDMKSEQVLVNDESPWASFLVFEETQNFTSDNQTREHRNKRLNHWIQKNLHSKIEKILYRKE